MTETELLLMAEELIKTLQLVTVNAIDPKDFAEIRGECDKWFAAFKDDRSKETLKELYSDKDQIDMFLTYKAVGHIKPILDALNSKSGSKPATKEEK
jgi:hypothetical protein